MIRLAACLLLGCLAATPAAAACRTVSEAVSSIKAGLPASAFVGEIPAALVPTVRAWLESEGVPYKADRILQIVGDRGLALVLIEGERACDGGQAVVLLGAKAGELVALVRRFQELKGMGPERSA